MPDGAGAAPRLALLKLRQEGVVIEIERTGWGHRRHLGRRRLPWGCRSACWVPQSVQRVPVPRGQPCQLQSLSCRRQFTHHGQLLSSGCAPIWTWSPPLPDARGRSLSRDTLSVGDQVQPIASKEFLEPRLQLLPRDRPTSTWSTQQHAWEEEEELPPSILLHFIAMVPPRHDFFQRHAHSCSEAPLKNEGNCFHRLRSTLEHRAQLTFIQQLESGTDGALVDGEINHRFLHGLELRRFPANYLCQTLLQQNLAQARTVPDFRSQSVVMIVDLGQTFRCL